ncbi:ABC transporter permease [Luteococcus sp. Sow4_B9]|uniref:ABC transporter permease n=1 Tax=Luteococcus sp. Sow4_B9 TaxID=3438792 RepID=UPI003F9E6BF3
MTTHVGRRSPRSPRDSRGGSPAIPAAALLGCLLLGLPLASLLLGAPWLELPTIISDPAVQSTLRLSLLSATAAMLLSFVLGTPLAWLLASGHGRWVGPLRVLVTLPMVLPPVVGGVALMLAFGRTGAIGRWLWEGAGIQLPFTMAAVVLAETFVAMPFLVTSVEGALRQRDIALEEAAMTMGASEWRILRHVTLPLVWPSLAAGLVLAWARALGEFGATITFAGNLPGRTQTMPMAIYLAMQTDPERAVGLSALLLLVSATVLFLLRGQWLVRPREMTTPSHPGSR